MSYSQYRQRNESATGVTTAMNITSSDRKGAIPESEDEEQITQEWSFTGHASNRSTSAIRQTTLNSSKRTSKMGRLKTAPVIF